MDAGTKIISGSQDSIGIVFPGVNKLDYPKEDFWPEQITPETSPDVLEFIEKHLYFITLSPRIGDFDVLASTNINTPNAKNLADAANKCWNAIQNKNLKDFGTAMRESFEAQIAMFPNMLTPAIQEILDSYKDKALGWKLSGAGGGGYLVLVSEKPITNALQIRIVRS